MAAGLQVVVSVAVRPAVIADGETIRSQTGADVSGITVTVVVAVYVSPDVFAVTR